MILASASPRRKEILGRLAVPFAILAAAADETPRPGEKPERAARRVAEAKAREVAGLVSRGEILGADTVVVYRGQILGKPKDATEALATLRRLRGHQHRVITGICLLSVPSGDTYRAAVTTRVWMRDYSDTEIAAYVATGEPFDKAGSYAIQSREFHPVERIQGCYLNVVGLPLCEVVRGLVRLGYPLPPDKVEALGPPCRFCEATGNVPTAKESNDIKQEEGRLCQMDNRTRPRLTIQGRQPGRVQYDRLANHLKESLDSRP